MEKLTVQEVTAELKSMSEADQAMRNRVMEEYVGDSSIDDKNTARMKEIVATYGWPTISAIGAEASDDAWLLVQHADHDAKFQEHCLELMKQLPAAEVSPSNIAYLEDRVRVNTGKPQLYGTQFDGGSYTGEPFKPRPIEDPEHLEERRQKMRLKPFAEYIKEMNKENDKLMRVIAQSKKAKGN